MNHTPAAPPPAIDSDAHHDAEVRIELLSKPVYLCAVRDFMRQVCRRHGFHDDQTAQIVLAVDEALANVMKHGYANHADGHIWLAISPFAQSQRGPGLRIVIEDTAKQVDLASIKSRDLAEVRPGGLGVHIIKQVMDEATYAHREGGVGMRLTLVKHLSSPAVCATQGDKCSTDMTSDSASKNSASNNKADNGCCGGSHGC
ncbi:MAG TPA: ATP-binding protein [Phycisphaerales bacterium]|nr:ATP-binding protein [Phycisphaerales bacterium]